MGRPERNHFTVILSDIYTSFKALIIPIILVLVSKSGRRESGFLTRFVGSMEIRYVIVLVLAVLIVLVAVLKWYRKTYYIRDGLVIVEEGILVSKRREIPINKIQTINISRNVLQNILGTAALKIDSGNSTANSAEVSIIAGKDYAEGLKESIIKMKYELDGGPAVSEESTGNVDEMGIPLEASDNIHAGKAEDLKNSKSFSVTTKQLVIAGLTSNGLFAGVAFLASIYALLDDFADFAGDIVKDWLAPLASAYDFKSMSVPQIIIIAFVILTVYLILSLAASILGSIIKYYRFTVKREDNKLIISYGLFNVRNYIIPIEKIKVIYIKQSFLKQIFGIRSIHVESIGYGNEKGESSIIYPAINRIGESMLLESVLPEFVFKGDMVRVPVRSLRRFLISPVLLPLLLCIIASVIFGRYGFISFVIIPVFILIGLLEYRNSAAGKKDRLLCISSNSFTRKISIVNIDGVQSVTRKVNFFQRRKALFDLVVSIQSNVFGTSVRVKNLDNSFTENLSDIDSACSDG